MGVWAIWDLPTAVANMFCKSIFSIQTCGPLMRWWNHLSSSLMGSSAMGTHIASAWRKFGAIGSSKRTGWVWPSFGAENHIRLLLKLCWTWDLLPTLQEWLNLKFFFQCKLICHECKADKETYMRRTLQAERYSIDEFWGHCIKPGNICFLAWTLFCFHQGQWSLYLFISPLQKLYVLIRDMFPSGQIAH